MKKPDAILFDWDGTLVDTLDVLLASYNEIFSSFGMTLWSAEDAKNNIRLSAREIFPHLFGDRADEARNIFYGAIEKYHLERLTPMQDAEALLKKIHELGITIGIVSNKRTIYLEQEAQALNWSQYIGSYVGAGRAGKDKPSLDVIDLALKDLGLPQPENTWFVGDTDVDMECAGMSGCLKVFILHGFGTLEEAEKHRPEIIVSSCAELISKLDFEGEKSIAGSAILH